MDVKDNEPENIEEIVVKLVLENGTTVEKKIENPTDKKIDLLKPFDDVVVPVRVQKIVVIIKTKHLLNFGQNANVKKDCEKFIICMFIK